MWSEVPAALQCQSTWSAARGGVGALGGLLCPPCGTRHSRSTCRGSGHSPLLRTLLKQSRGQCPGVHGSAQDGASPWALPTHRPDGPALAGGISPGLFAVGIGRTRETRQRAASLPTHSRGSTSGQLAPQARVWGRTWHVSWWPRLTSRDTFRRKPNSPWPSLPRSGDHLPSTKQR